MLPFAYGGPSCSTNLRAPRRRASIFRYRSIAAHRPSVSGSLVGRLAFIGKSVRGRLTVSFHSGMGIHRFYNELMTTPYVKRSAVPICQVPLYNVLTVYIRDSHSSHT